MRQPRASLDGLVRRGPLHGDDGVLRAGLPYDDGAAVRRASERSARARAVRRVPRRTRCGALVESKLAGTRQLWQVATSNVPTPVPSPGALDAAGARARARHCHWPEKFHGDEVRVFREYAEDEQNTETVTTLTMFVGGGSAALGVGTGIHWHMNLDNEIEYITTDPKRQVIPYVRLRDARRHGARVHRRPARRRSSSRRANAAGWTAWIATAARRIRSSPTPERAVNEAIAQGRIPRDAAVRPPRSARRDHAGSTPTSRPPCRRSPRRLRDHYRKYPSVDAAARRAGDRGHAGSSGRETCSRR